jgi:23S rRNA (uridine2552-2'-O)-methyltransferase
MAASSTGHAQTDHWRIMALAENAFEFAKDILAPGGHFCAKVLMGGTEKDLLQSLRKHFEKVVHFKPKSSRKDSSEMYVIGLRFKTNDT